jgi:murein DD-endopeptidase MepM/ murein hydrolase activator NlpD
MRAGYSLPSQFGGKQKSSQFRSNGPKASSSYTLIVIPNNTGQARRFAVPRFALTGFVLIVFCFMGAFAALSLHLVKMRTYVSDFEKLRVENNSIRSEAAALVAKLEEVQQTLNQVDQYSDKLREAANIDQLSGKKKKSDKATDESAPGKKPLKQKSNQRAGSGTPDATTSTAVLPPNIGPLSREEYALSRQQAAVQQREMRRSVNFEQLEFKSLFQTLSRIEMKGGTQALGLKNLIGEVQAYQQRVAATPLLAPVKGYLSSNYGVRQSPFSGNGRMHWGVDIAAPMGDPIYSAAGGTVAKVTYAEDFGKYVEVDHGFGVVTRYAHAQKILVREGDKIQPGTLLGKVGMTGRTTGPHLHYEILVNGKRVDPLTYIREW